MNIGEKIRTYRRNCNLTQKELGEKIGVSDKTISSWENSRTMPDLEMLSLLHQTLGLPIDFPSIESATESIEPTLPDEPLVNKKSYSSKPPLSLKKALSFFLLVFFLVYLFLINYQYKNETVDRFNPFLKPQIGYTTLPVGYVENSIEHWVCNDIFGHGTWLSFHAGEVEKGKNHAVIKHKGKHVMNVRLLSWEAIPSDYQEILSMTQAPRREQLPSYSPVRSWRPARGCRFSHLRIRARWLAPHNKDFPCFP